MYRIFIVEDDRTIAQAVAHLAESWGLEVRCARDFRAVTAEAAEFQPHLIILDIALPCFDGYHWCRELRKQTSAPILFLSSAGDNMNVIMAMNFGADDFIAKPFDGGVLMAKVQAMLRRSYDMAAPAVLRERRGAQLSADDQKLTYQGQTVELTKNEYRILSCLMESAGKVVSREKLMQRLWETDSFVDENTLTVNVNRLRRKLAGVGLVEFIATRHGVGVHRGVRDMELLKAYLKERRLTLAAFLLFVGVFAVSFALYGLPLAAVGYPAGLCVLLGACLAAWDYGRAARRHKALKRLREAGEAVLLDLPAMTTVEGADCAAVVETLRRELRRQETARAARWEDMTAYYTAWVHQIKTPIAAMRLTLQGEDTPAARRLMTELGRVEQYVDMALTYLRLEEGGSDYVIRTCAVDDVVRAAVRRFAGEFIDRRIALDYTPVEWETVTDGKWLTFVVEQLLSNALKYTGQGGTVRIYREGDDLCIRDSGMGIAPEDLPRVFDMGYTGQNGRLDRRSSGIGLYLCRRICRNLRHEIRIESVPGAGTTVRLTLGRGDFLPE